MTEYERHSTGCWPLSHKDVACWLSSPRNESDPGIWLVPEDFDPETKPYDSFRGHFVYFPLADAHINFCHPADFNFGTKDFTILFWHNALSFNQYGPAILRKKGPTGPGFEVRDWADGPRFDLGFVVTLEGGGRVMSRAQRILYHAPESDWKQFHEKVGSREWCSLATVRKGASLNA